MLSEIKPNTPGQEQRREALLAAIEQRRRLIDSLHKNAAATVPVERVVAFLHTVTNLVLEIVPDRKQKLLFLERLRPGVRCCRLAGRDRRPSSLRLLQRPVPLAGVVVAG